jgi:beta-glucosidase
MRAPAPIGRRELLRGTAAAAAAALLPTHAGMAANPSPFPAGFVWGASSSAYQIEGAVAEDGRGPSIWDRFSHTQGRIADGTNGDIACDHYHRWAEDVELLAAGGFGAYRFSVSWPRVLPLGDGAVNPRGLDFYERLVDRLLARRVSPWLCLYHWDLPQALQDRGGWTNRDIAGRFADYAHVVARRLADRVRHWAMLNEPSVHAIFGHTLGVHAPGLTGWPNFVAAHHHQNLAQGLGLQAVRAERAGLSAGTVLSLQPVVPATPKDIDRHAAERFDAVWNRAALDPLFKGKYPDVLAASFAPLVQAGDMANIRQPVDFLGVNYYGRAHVVDDPNSPLSGAAFGPLPAGMPVTAMGWPIEPEGLIEVLDDLRRNYGNPKTFVTENGACFDDQVAADGSVHDSARLDFLRQHFAAAAEAIRRGCPLGGYFVWSLLDNFEWAEGVRRRFGIVRVDFATGARTRKDSYAGMTRFITGA